MNAFAERRRCVVDFLSFLETVGKAVANSLGLPALNVVSASWSYGMKLDNLVFKFRNADPEALFNGVASMTLDEFVHFSISPESFKSYHEWLVKARDMIEKGRISGTISTDTIATAMEGAKRCLVETSENPNGLKSSIRTFQAANSKKAKKTAFEITRTSTLAQISRDLSDCFGIKDGVDFFASLMDPEPAKAKKRPDDVASLNSLIKKSHKKREIKATIGIVDDAESAKQFIDSKKWVIVLDDMRLVNGRGCDRDASDVLCKLATLIALCMSKIKDKHPRAKIVSFIDAILNCMLESKSLGNAKEQGIQRLANAKVVERLEISAFPKMGLARAKSVFFRGGVDQQPPPPAQFPYPPGEPAQYGPAPNRQEVYVHQDPYMKTVAGLSVGAQCCQCCATWGIADAINFDGDMGNV